MKTLNQIFGLIVYCLSNGRIVTNATRERARQLRHAWAEHCDMMQRQLDEERARGWGFRYCDGKRTDF